MIPDVYILVCVWVMFCRSYCNHRAFSYIPAFYHTSAVKGCVSPWQGDAVINQACLTCCLPRCSRWHVYLSRGAVGFICTTHLPRLPPAYRVLFICLDGSSLFPGCHAALCYGLLPPRCPLTRERNSVISTLTGAKKFFWKRVVVVIIILLNIKNWLIIPVTSCKCWFAGG